MELPACLTPTIDPTRPEPRCSRTANTPARTTQRSRGRDGVGVDAEVLNPEKTFPPNLKGAPRWIAPMHRQLQDTETESQARAGNPETSKLVQRRRTTSTAKPLQTLSLFSGERERERFTKAEILTDCQTYTVRMLCVFLFYIAEGYDDDDDSWDDDCLSRSAARGCRGGRGLWLSIKESLKNLHFAEGVWKCDPCHITRCITAHIYFSGNFTLLSDGAIRDLTDGGITGPADCCCWRTPRRNHPANRTLQMFTRSRDAPEGLERFLNSGGTVEKRIVELLG